MIEALQRADARRTHGDDLPDMLTKGEECRAADADQLGVHLVIADVVSLDGAEGASAYVERDVQHGRALSA